MARRGVYGEALRTLGDVLDAESAFGATFVASDESVGMTWLGPTGAVEHRLFPADGLGVLMLEARERRAFSAGEPSTSGSPLGARSELAFRGERAELLRTLGQILDEQGDRLIGVTEEETGFRVRVLREGQSVARSFRMTELQAESQQRRAFRQR